jgi:hypothetical protein
VTSAQARRPNDRELKKSVAIQGIHMVLVRKPVRKRPHGRPRRRWEDNIKIALQEVECGGTDWIELVQDMDRWRSRVNAVMNLRVP